MSRSRAARSALLLAVLCATPARAVDWLERWDQAQAASRANGRPILIDFQAVWCYSCYYMEQRVLGKAGFRDAARELVALKLDVDEEEGRTIRDRYRARFLPSYVLVDAEGKELGRIVGEQTEADFLARLRELLGGTPGTPAGRLSALLDRGELEHAAALRAELERGDPSLARAATWRLKTARLDLKRAAAGVKGADARAAIKTLAELEQGCALAYDAYEGAKLLDAGKPEDRELLAALAAALEPVVARRVLAEPAEGRCADFRSPPDALAELHAALGKTAEREKLLGRVLEILRAQHGGKTGADRNRDDNLRYFLDLAGAHEELGALYPRLIEAYPSDYVYAYRYARWLKERGRGADALAWAEKAYLLSYGANRLSVAGLRGEILLALGRREEAERLLRREIAANRARFPEAAERLEKLLSK